MCLFLIFLLVPELSITPCPGLPALAFDKKVRQLNFFFSLKKRRFLSHLLICTLLVAKGKKYHECGKYDSVKDYPQRESLFLFYLLLRSFDISVLAHFLGRTVYWGLRSPHFPRNVRCRNSTKPLNDSSLCRATF